MSHQALARRWRPRDFGSLIGQEPVVKALTHALSSQRLHHAYLLTGTRGVGKTTIARILAKALNCETGVSATPCGQCSACTGIDAGRFVDYIEMDAASNRGVEEMTQVLEQAVYSPSSGRYKVYVIDEVHMLSNHAFNAMLKTLEEPPGHVIFVLATTDPQKVPVTVLSRCLQFNLKNMTPRAIAAHLQDILQREAIACEPGALTHLSIAARGSMRDALSLLDQAIGFGAGAVREPEVREMLGVVDARQAEQILQALIDDRPDELVAIAERAGQANVAVEPLLQDLAALLQRVAVIQAGVRLDDEAYRAAEPFATTIEREQVQVYYQVALYGARDAGLALDPVSGLTMCLLRMHSFRPDSGSSTSDTAVARAAPRAVPMAARKPESRPESRQEHHNEQQDEPRAESRGQPRPAAERGHRPGPAVAPASATKSGQAAAPGGHSAPNPGTAAKPEFDGDWPGLARLISVSGFAQQFLQQSELLRYEDFHFAVRVPLKALAEPATVGRVRDALTAHFGRPVRLTAETGSVGGTTAAAQSRREMDARVARAHESIDADPFVRTLIDDFGGRVLPDSVKPNESPNGETP